MDTKKNISHDNLKQACEVFDRINLGIMILDHDTKDTFFTNKYFKSLTKDKITEIIYIISRNILMKRKSALRKDVSISIDHILGYSTYKISSSHSLVLLSDISSKKMISKAKEISQFYNELSLLIGEIAHEIGNPLSSVTTTLEVLLESIETWGNEKKIIYIERAINEIDRLSHHLRKLRQFSSLEKLVMEPVILRSIIEDVFRNTRDILGAKQIHVRNDVDKTVVGYLDKKKFCKVMLNLLQNSVEVLSPRGVIRLGTTQIDEYMVKLIFKSNAPPVPESIRKNFFSPFFTKEEEGFRKNMAVSMKKMTRMGGTILLAEPEKDWGMVFYLYIPVYNRQLTTNPHVLELAT